MKIDALGHVVVKVRDLEAAERFYHGVLGLPIQARSERHGMTFFTLGHHHDFAILAVGGDAPAADPKAVGTHHVAFRVRDVEALRGARDALEALGVEVAAVDHHVTRSLYFADPDGNALELFADGADDWKSDPDALFTPVRELPL